MTCKFDATHFAEGYLRFVYKGTYTYPNSKKGQLCVVKKNKDSHTWRLDDWEIVEKLHEEAKELAQKFNIIHGCQIKFVDLEIGKAVTDSSSGPALNEYLIVEDYIPGNFTKWSNNFGYISTESKLMPAFMHWSWVHTKGQQMIADLQGVRIDDDTYILTDPALLSYTRGDNGVYGCTDTGVKGMAMFFLNHTCNEFCDELPAPGYINLLTNSECLKQLLSALRVSADYAYMMQYPENARRSMSSEFPKIIRRGE